MAITRRRLCATAGLAFVGASGCLGGGDSGDADGADDVDTDGSDGDADDENADDELPYDLEEWAWSGTLPVDSVVQHYDPSCGCCSRYIAYLEGHDVDVERAETSDLDAVKAAFDVPADARSCHTVEFGDYLVEGHVPLEAVEQLLDEAPDVDGVAAPGMPEYSPGMGPRGEEPLVIYAFETSGEVAEYVEI